VAKYPLSVRDTGSVSDFFNDVLALHFKENDKILDPCCGERIIWQRVKGKYDVTFSDIRNDLPGIESKDYRDLKYDSCFDGILFDPPYLFGVKAKKDKREDAYGGYAQTYDNLIHMMTEAPKHLINYLKPDGKIILKCSDQYYVPEHKFYSLSDQWYISFRNAMTNNFKKLAQFYLIDRQIFIVHRVVPTAYQVKDRGASVQNYTFFLVFQKKNIGEPIL